MEGIFKPKHLFIFSYKSVDSECKDGEESGQCVTILKAMIFHSGQKWKQALS